MSLNTTSKDAGDLAIMTFLDSLITTPHLEPHRQLVLLPSLGVHAPL